MIPLTQFTWRITKLKGSQCFPRTVGKGQFDFGLPVPKARLFEELGISIKGESPSAPRFPESLCALKVTATII
jgi:hypothetical protein